MSPAPERRPIGPLVVALVLVAALAHAETRVTLRHGADLPRGEAVAVTAHGIAFADPHLGERAPSLVVPWHRVALVEGDLAPEAIAYVEVARQAWRAQTRLDRGDALSAEPLFERLLSRYDDNPGPMRRVAAKGLTRCRLERGAHAAAVTPWMIWLAEQEGWARSRVEPDSRLLPDLPPMFLPSPAIRAMPLPTIDSDGVGVDAVAWWYAEAIRFEGGRPSQGAPPEIDARDADAHLVADIVSARAGDASQRRDARRRLRDRLDERRPSSTKEAWARAWILTALGRSLTREPEPDLVREGVVDLLTVSSAYAGVSPRLASLALAEAAVASHRIGLDREATTLRRELRGRYPGYPALLWPDLNAWPDHEPLDVPRGAQPIVSEAPSE